MQHDFHPLLVRPPEHVPGRLARVPGREERGCQRSTWAWRARHATSKTGQSVCKKGCAAHKAALLKRDAILGLEAPWSHAKEIQCVEGHLGHLGIHR